MLKLAACTISFRHLGWSMDEIVRWAAGEGFESMELWGAHARGLLGRTECGAEWLAERGLRVVMLSDYLPLEGSLDAVENELRVLLPLARRWGAPKLRVFAGSRSSQHTPADERRGVVERLRAACARVADAGMALLIETHPRTLADTAEATERLLQDVDHPALRVNFDVLHIWQGGDEPGQALGRLAPFVSHYHLKNVRSRAELEVFTPENVFAADGSRAGMVGLFEGALDYRDFLRGLPRDQSSEASLEWFGSNVEVTLSRDRKAALAVLEGGRFG